MGTLENHLDLYRNFKKDAVSKDNYLVIKALIVSSENTK